MNFDFLKTPSSIAAIVLVVVFFLPMTPYYKEYQKADKDKGDEERTWTISGLGMLTGAVKIAGSDVEDLEKTEAKNTYFAYQDEYYDELYNYLSDDDKKEAKKEAKEKYKPVFGIFDKLGILVIIGAGLMLFVGYQKSSNASPILDDDKMGWVKILVIGLGLMIYSRYCFMPGAGIKVALPIGAWISLLAVIFLALEDRIMKLMGK